MSAAAAGFNEDFLDMLRALVDAGAEFLVVGAHAMAVHGVPRATGDLDILVKPSTENAARVVAALRAFGAPVDAHDIERADFERPGSVYQVGQPPRRIDLLTEVSGLAFDDAWVSRVAIDVAGLSIPFLGLEALRRNKHATGRQKDLLDLELLETAKGGSE